MPVPESGAGFAGSGTAGGSPVLFSARPEPMSFLFRYLLSFTPVVLVILCIVIRGVLDSLFLAASHQVTALLPVPPAPAPGAASAAMAQYQGMLGFSTAGFGEFATIALLLIVPVGIFLLAACIGASLRQTAAWTGPSLTLLLSAGTALVLAGGFSFSASYFVAFLQGVAFLVQPFSILTSFLVLWQTEKFRRSIRYEITPDAVVIRGGILTRREQIIPHHRIGRVVLEQGPVGSRFNFGTVIARNINARDAAIPFLGFLASVLNALIDPGAEGSTASPGDPLECLYGIPDPKTAQRMLEAMMYRPSPGDHTK
jgi:membrane protein YdbS with pleckstrin-like domain